jgi:hypothetical protein
MPGTGLTRMDEITGSLSEDGETLTISSPKAPGFALSLRADEVERLISALAGMRTRMKPPVPFTMLRGRTYKGVLDPNMVSEIDGLRENILIHLRDPGAGWLHFGFSAPQARALGRYLIEKANTVDAARAKIPDQKN